MRSSLYIAVVGLVSSSCSSATPDVSQATPTPSEAAPSTTPAAVVSVAPPTPSASAAPPLPAFQTRTVALPGGGPDGVAMDFLLYYPATSTVWVPAGNTGSVDVLDANDKVTRIEGFATQEMPGREGKKRTVGPSSVTPGEDVVYIGNRGDFSICAVDPKKLTRSTCSPKLDAMPDGIVYVAPTKEVWVTTPKDKSIRILDAKTLKPKGKKLSYEGSPEGYAVDAKRGRFYTNLEDKDQTLAIDLKSHKTLSTWSASCGADGPHGVRLVENDGFLLIACSTKVEAMDVGHDGKILSSVDTGDGVDDIDFASATRLLYVGAAKAAKLVIAHLDESGVLSVTATVPTAPGARNAAVDANGNAYLSHAKSSEIIIVSPPKK